jgi:hypothetical protein
MRRMLTRLRARFGRYPAVPRPLPRHLVGPARVGARASLAEFVAYCEGLAQPRVLELGTHRSEPERSTLHRRFVPHAGEFLGTDIEPGVDVDLVADVHRLSAVVGAESFDAVMSFSTFEHLKYPGLAAHEVMKVLTVGGALFIQTHHTFGLHAYPFDFFRFSREALASLFGTRMGFEVVATDYEFPACILSEEDAQSGPHLPAYLNVQLFGVKTAPTPDDYVYELDYAPAP